MGTSARGKISETMRCRRGLTERRMCPPGTYRRTNQDKRAECPDQRGRGNKHRVAGADVVIAAGEVMPQFVRQKNRQQRYREGKSGEKRGRMAIGESERLRKSVQRRSLVVRIGRSEMRACQETRDQRQEKQKRRKDERTSWRMRRSCWVIGPVSGQVPPRIGAQKSGSALLCFRWGHEVLLGRTCNGTFQALEFFAGLEAHRFAGRNADLFSRARIPPNAGLARLHAKNSELAQFDALPLAQGALQRFKDRFHGLFRFGATDVGLAYHRVYNIELDHAGLRSATWPDAIGCGAGCQDVFARIDSYLSRTQFFPICVRRSGCLLSPTVGFARWRWSTE